MKKYYLYVLSFPNNKIYIGLSSNPSQRLSAHKSMAKNGSTFPVHQAINKYGKENVNQEIICIGSKEYIANLEIKMIAIKKTQDREFGYNLTNGGDLSPMDVPELRAKVSATKKRIGFSEKQYAAIARNIGRKASPETCEKLRISHLGQKPSESQRLKMIGRTPPNKGVPHTAESNEKNRKAALERWSDPEKRERYLSIVRNDKRRKQTAETTKKQWQDPVARVLMQEKARITKLERSDAIKASIKAAWDDPVKKEARLAKLRATYALKALSR